MSKTQRQHASYPKIGRVRFLEKLRPFLSPSDLERVESAYIFSKYGHRGEFRDGGEIRYFEHPKAVAWILIRELGIHDWKTIVLALLHDLSEDSFILSPSRIERNFGKNVAVGVQLLTKHPKRGYIARLRRSRDIRVLLVKLADRLHNLRTLGNCTREKQLRQVAETQRVHLKLAMELVELLPASRRWQAEYLHTKMTELCNSITS